MKKNKLSASLATRKLRRIPTSASEKPIVIYVSSDSLRMVKGDSASRGMHVNVLFTDEPAGEPAGDEEPGKSMPRNLAATLSYLPEVPALISCRVSTRSQRR